MIAFDYQPFSTVEYVGFCHLLHAVEPKYNIPSLQYFMDKVLPNIHDCTKAAVAKEMANVKSSSFPRDIWNTAVDLH